MRSSLYTATVLSQPTFANADGICVTSRLKRRLAPVRLHYKRSDDLGTIAYLFKDVTTRGAYYPDKSMATAVVRKR